MIIGIVIYLILCGLILRKLKKIESRKWIQAEVIIWLLADIVLLVAKYGTNDNFLEFLIISIGVLIAGLGAMMAVIALVWRKKKPIDTNNIPLALSHRKWEKGIVIGVFAFTVICLLIPGFNSKSRFLAHRKDYEQVANIIFTLADQGTIQEEERFHTNYTLNTEYAIPLDFYLKQLYQHAGVYRVELIDGNTIYFFNGAVFQSIDGIVLTKDQTTLPTDNKVPCQAPRYEKLGENAYYVEGEL